MNISDMKALLVELDKIEVHGTRNVDVLAGCMNFLCLKIKEMQQPKPESAPVSTGEPMMEEMTDG